MNTYLRLIRPFQWVKNLLMFFPPFLAGTLFREGTLQSGVLPFASFCLAASIVYVVNDIIDREHDLAHPRKRNRPVASGKISVSQASTVALILLLLLVGVSFRQSSPERLYLLCYLLLSLAYTIALRDLPVVDLFCIATGFILRLHYGGVVFGVVISEWLFLSVVFLSLFLSAGKRLNEHISLDQRALQHRRSLGAYPDGFLSGIMFMTGAAALVTYSMYVVSRHTLVYTVPLCAFGLLRFLQRALAGKGGDPTESLLRDPLMFIVGLIWAIMVGFGIYQ